MSASRVSLWKPVISSATLPLKKLASIPASYSTLRSGLRVASPRLLMTTAGCTDPPTIAAVAAYDSSATVPPGCCPEWPYDARSRSELRKLTLDA